MDKYGNRKVFRWGGEEKIMTWEDVDDILFDGTVEQIKAVRCPECGGTLRFEYFKENRNRETRCLSCHTVLKAHKAHYIPNFEIYSIKGTAK